MSYYYHSRLTGHSGILLAFCGSERILKCPNISCASAPLDGFEFQCLMDNNGNGQLLSMNKAEAKQSHGCSLHMIKYTANFRFRISLCQDYVHSLPVLLIPNG